MKITSLLSLVLVTSSFAQSDYQFENGENKPQLSAGIYLTFGDFITNNPIDPRDIKMPYDYQSRDYYQRLYKEGFFYFYGADSLEKVSMPGIWGYSDGRDAYLNKLNSQKVSWNFAKVMNFHLNELVSSELSH